MDKAEKYFLISNMGNFFKKHISQKYSLSGSRAVLATNSVIMEKSLRVSGTQCPL